MLYTWLWLPIAAQLSGQRIVTHCCSVAFNWNVIRILKFLWGPHESCINNGIGQSFKHADNSFKVFFSI